MVEEDPAGPRTEPTDGDEVAGPAEDMAELKAVLEEALREKEQFHLLAQRSQADLANYKRRVADDMEKIRLSANSQVLLKILSFTDDFERAMSHIPDDEAMPGWLDGLNLVHRNLLQVLESEGIVKIEAHGQPFEPREHESISYEETDTIEAGRVATVIREGYTLHGKVLRPAQVTVSRAPQSEEQPESSGQEA